MRMWPPQRVTTLNQDWTELGIPAGIVGRNAKERKEAGDHWKIVSVDDKVDETVKTG